MRLIDGWFPWILGTAAILLAVIAIDTQRRRLSVRQVALIVGAAAVVTTGAVRMDGASTHYAPIEYPAVAHHEVVAALLRAARELAVPSRPGVTCSCDTFYPGQERYDSFTGYVPRRFQGITEEWRRLGVLNYEMEAATLLTLTSAMGLRGGCAAGVVVNRTRSEAITKADLDLGEGNAVRVAALAVKYLV